MRELVFLSMYVEDAPMGLAFDQIMRALQTEFPNQKIGLGELDYWLADASQAWWAFSQTDPTTTARQAVAHQYYAAALGYSPSVCDGFWWDFVVSMPADPQLANSVRQVVKAMDGTN